MESRNLGPSPLLDRAEYNLWKMHKGTEVRRWWDECLEADAAEMQKVRAERDAGGGGTLTEEIGAEDVVTEEVRGGKRVLIILGDMLEKAKKCLGLSR